MSSYGSLSDFPRLFSPLGRIGLAIDLRLKPLAFLGRHELLLKAADVQAVWRDVLGVSFAESSFSPEDTFPSGRGTGTPSSEGTKHT